MHVAIPDIGALSVNLDHFTDSSIMVFLGTWIVA